MIQIDTSSESIRIWTWFPVVSMENVRVGIADVMEAYDFYSNNTLYMQCA